MGLELKNVFGFWNANEAKPLIGKPVYVADSIEELAKKVVNGDEIGYLQEIYTSKIDYPFLVGDLAWRLIYVIPTEASPQYRAYTFTELLRCMQDGKVFKHKDSQDFGVITNIHLGPKKTILTVCGFFCNPADFISAFACLDGSPAGVRVVEDNSDGK